MCQEATHRESASELVPPRPRYIATDPAAGLMLTLPMPSWRALGNAPYHERNRQLVIRVLAGSTMRSLAREYGLSNDRVRQITQKYVQGVLSGMLPQPGERWINCVRRHRGWLLRQLKYVPAPPKGPKQ